MRLITLIRTKGLNFVVAQWNQLHVGQSAAGGISRRLLSNMQALGSQFSYFEKYICDITVIIMTAIRARHRSGITIQLQPGDAGR